MSANNLGFENDDIIDKITRNTKACPKADPEKQKSEKLNKPNSPIGGYKWIVCFALLMHFALFGGVFFTFGLIFVELSESFQTGKGETAWITSINIACSFIAGPFASVLCQSLGYWAVAILGTLLASAGVLISMFAGNINILYVTYGFIGGIGNGMIYHVSLVCIIVIFSEWKSLMNGACACAIGVGIFMISPLAEWCINTYGWRGTILIETGLLLHGVLVGLIIRPLSKTFMNNTTSKPSVPTELVSNLVLKPDGRSSLPNFDDANNIVTSIGNMDVAGNVPSTCTTGQSSYMVRGCAQIRRYDVRFFLEKCGLSLLGSPDYAVHSLSSFLNFFAIYMPLAFIPDLAKTKGIDGSLGAWLLSASGMTITVCMMGVGLLADQPWVNRFALQGTSLVLSGLFTALMPVCNSFLTLLFSVVLFSLFQGYTSLMNSLITGDLVDKEKLSQGIGLVCWFGGLGNLLGAPFAGWLYDITGNYSTSFWACGLVLVTAGILVLVTLFIHRRRDT